jgi:hypothetical protein
MRGRKNPLKTINAVIGMSPGVQNMPNYVARDLASYGRNIEVANRLGNHQTARDASPSIGQSVDHLSTLVLSWGLPLDRRDNSRDRRWRLPSDQNRAPLDVDHVAGQDGVGTPMLLSSGPIKVLHFRRHSMLRSI